jgi:hypothetical protein
MSSIKEDQHSSIIPNEDISFDSPILLKNVKSSQNAYLHKSQLRSNTSINNYPKLTQGRISQLLKVCSESRQLVRKDVKETDGLGKIQDYHSNMKEAFVRYDDGKPFFRDLKVMEIMEDMEILNNIDKEINAQKMTLPLILSNKKKKTS